MTSKDDHSAWRGSTCSLRLSLLKTLDVVTMLPAENMYENIINFSLINPISHWLCVLCLLLRDVWSLGGFFGETKAKISLDKVETPPP